MTPHGYTIDAHSCGSWNGKSIDFSTPAVKISLSQSFIEFCVNRIKHRNSKNTKVQNGGIYSERIDPVRFHLECLKFPKTENLTRSRIVRYEKIEIFCYFPVGKLPITQGHRNLTKASMHDVVSSISPSATQICRPTSKYRDGVVREAH